MDMKMYLRIGAELYLKRLVWALREGVEINRNFRNEGYPRPQSRITMLEFSGVPRLQST